MTSNKFKVYFFVIVAFALVLHLHDVSRADDQAINTTTEKPISIKGLSLGMNINDARNIAINLFGKDYSVTPIGNSEDILKDTSIDTSSDPFNTYNLCNSFNPIKTLEEEIKTVVAGTRRFFILNKCAVCLGFIRADKDDKVTRISLSGEIVDFLYTASKVNADDFVQQFEKNFGLPGLPWIPYGWSYPSPNGYTLTIKTNKLIDLKKSDVKVVEETKQKIKF